MPRIRTIKPDFFTDRTIGRMGPDAALVFQALWCWADDTGAALCDADRLKAECFAFWPALSEECIRAALDLLESSGRIVRYRVGEDGYCTIPNFLKHQRINNPSKARFPQPSGSPTIALPHGKGKGEGKGVGKGEGVGEGFDHSAPDGAVDPRVTEWKANLPPRRRP